MPDAESRVGLSRIDPREQVASVGLAPDQRELRFGSVPADEVEVALEMPPYGSAGRSTSRTGLDREAVLAPAAARLSGPCFAAANLTRPR